MLEVPLDETEAYITFNSIDDENILYIYEDIGNTKEVGSRIWMQYGIPSYFTQSRNW